MLLAYRKHIDELIATEENKKPLIGQCLYLLKTTCKAFSGLIQIYSHSVFQGKSSEQLLPPPPASLQPPYKKKKKKEKSHLGLCSLLHEAASFLAVALVFFWLLSFKIALNLSHFIRPAVI